MHARVLLVMTLLVGCSSSAKDAAVDAGTPPDGAREVLGDDSGDVLRDASGADSGAFDSAQATRGDAGMSGDTAPTNDAPTDAEPDSSLGSANEPKGMTKQIDTGAITALLPQGFTMYSPAVMTAEGESSKNLIRVPDGTGLRLLYEPTLSGGYSPVRFGTTIASPGLTTYYQRWRIRTVPNWAGPRNGNGVKLCEPRAIDQGPGSGTGTNDILMMWPNGGSNTQMSAMEGLQGPNGHFANLGVNQGHIGNMSDGQWHWDERVFVAESKAGAGDGQYLAYLDGVLVAKYTNVPWVAPGGTWGITALVFDPTFGGAPLTTHPLAGDFWDFDQLYVSTK
jgi:hypothetical protein